MNTRIRVSFFCAALSMLPLFTTATVRTVSNNPLSPGQYTSVQAAINAAGVGDTIYVQGSQDNYGSVTIDRRIILIGAGHNVNNTQQNLNTVFNSITLDSNHLSPLPFTVSGTRVMGVHCTAFNTASGDLINNVILERNRFGSIALTGNGWIIRNNVTSTVNMGNSHNILITNNIIGGSVSGSSNSITNNGIVIDHNFFETGTNSLLYLQNAIISNNIFYHQNNPASVFNYVFHSTFNNNITYGPASSSLILPPAGVGNTGSGNMNNTNPNQVNVPIPFGAFTLAHTYNYALNTGSPALGAATDNTNIGPTGGTHPMGTFNGITTLPQMSAMTINNPVLAPGQQLNVNFKARRTN